MGTSVSPWRTVCGCRDLGEALRRIAEGCSMIRTKGEAGTGNVVEAGAYTRSHFRTTRAYFCPVPLNLSLLRPPYHPNQSVDVFRRCSS